MQARGRFFSCRRYYRHQIIFMLDFIFHGRVHSTLSLECPLVIQPFDLFVKDVDFVIQMVKAILDPSD